VRGPMRAAYRRRNVQKKRFAMRYDANKRKEKGVSVAPKRGKGHICQELQAPRSRLRPLIDKNADDKSTP
jgi:hypothetical protein